MEIKKNIFGVVDNIEINCYIFKNSKGLELSVVNYGGRIIKLITPDKDGKLENIVLGYDKLEDYVNDTKYFGAICGRTSGRIKGGNFKLDGKKYNLNINDTHNNLHGGIKNFSHAIWEAEIIENKDEVGVIFSYTSLDGEEGYPGTVNIKVKYVLNENNELFITYEGISDKNTLLNMTNHSYFNLSGDFKRDVLTHNLKINSDKFCELNKDLTPTGKLLDVDDTPFDLRGNSQLNEHLFQNHEQLDIALRGIDHPFILNENFGEEIVFSEQISGRTLTIETDQKCVIVYTSNNFNNDFLINDVNGKKHLAVCLETQGFPDAINNPHFPQNNINKGELYSAKTKFSFGLISY
jgi:aldose 1-epimerase